MIMNKKVVSVILVVSILSVFMINFVSAATLLEGITSVGESVIKILELFFKALLGGEVDSGMLFPKVLFLVLIFGIIWLSLNKIDLFSDHPPILVIIAAIVSILAVRGISSTELIKTMLLPSEALGMALVAGIPFVIYFIIVFIGFKGQPSIVRRVAWIFFAVIFMGLWMTRMEELGKLQYIYLFTAIGAVIMALIDGTIKGLFAKIEADKLKNINELRILAELKRQKVEYDEMLDKGVLTESEYDRLIKNLRAKVRVYTNRKVI